MVSGCIDLPEEHMEWILIWILCGVFTAIIASNKGKSGLGWLVMGLIFGIFALLFVGFMPPSPKEAPPLAQQTKRNAPSVRKQSRSRPRSANTVDGILSRCQNRKSQTRQNLKRPAHLQNKAGSGRMIFGCPQQCGLFLLCQVPTCPQKVLDLKNQMSIEGAKRRWCGKKAYQL